MYTITSDVTVPKSLLTTNKPTGSVLDAAS